LKLNQDNESSCDSGTEIEKRIRKWKILMVVLLLYLYHFGNLKFIKFNII